LIFYVKPRTNWSPVEQARVLRHFNLVKLSITFASNANDEMITFKDHLISIRSRKGPAEVKAYLDEERNRYGKRLNSWQHVMYQTLSASLWFINDGYLKILG
jgi:hypothetical protein